MENLVEIIGRTERRKNGLVISSDKDYFVKNKDSWEEEFFDKEVRVKGIVSISSNNALLPPNDDGIIRQGIPTNSWEEYEALNKQYWIDIQEIELL